MNIGTQVESQTSHYLKSGEEGRLGRLQQTGQIRNRILGKGEEEQKMIDHSMQLARRATESAVDAVARKYGLTGDQKARMVAKLHERSAAFARGEIDHL